MEAANADPEADVVGTNLTQTAARQAERFVRKVKEAAWRWRVTHHNLLPDWLKDNDFLHFGHRPQIPSFRSCFGSIFRIHTETGNIWTHLLGKNLVIDKEFSSIVQILSLVVGDCSYNFFFYKKQKVLYFINLSIKCTGPLQYNRCCPFT